MFELVQAGGWVMVPILLCSIAALAICIERLLALKPARIAPPHLLAQVWGWLRDNQLDGSRVRQLRQSSPLGRILAAGLVNARHGRVVMKESIEETASHVVHELERYLNPLGTIAVITPLLGLLGTVIGMIRVFSAIMVHGVGDPNEMAGGISEALITTAAGLSVAIPTYFFYRYFRGLVRDYVLQMEAQALKLLQAIEYGQISRQNFHGRGNH